MHEELRRFIVRGHKKVIDHCRFLLRSPTLRSDERELLEARLMTEEEALRQLTTPRV
jgi:hypothetical protein